MVAGQKAAAIAKPKSPRGHGLGRETAARGVEAKGRIIYEHVRHGKSSTPKHAKCVRKKASIKTNDGSSNTAPGPTSSQRIREAGARTSRNAREVEQHTPTGWEQDECEGEETTHNECTATEFPGCAMINQTAATSTAGLEEGSSGHVGVRAARYAGDPSGPEQANAEGRGERGGRRCGGRVRGRDRKVRPDAGDAGGVRHGKGADLTQAYCGMETRGESGRIYGTTQTQGRENVCIIGKNGPDGESWRTCKLGVRFPQSV